LYNIKENIKIGNNELPLTVNNNNYYYYKTLDDIKIENYQKRIDKSYQHKQNIKFMMHTSSAQDNKKNNIE